MATLQHKGVLQRTYKLVFEHEIRVTKKVNTAKTYIYYIIYIRHILLKNSNY